MPTNEERREVAAELRELAQESARRGDDGIDERACRVLLGQSIDLLDVVDAHFALSRLADLIDPEERTCRMTVLENARGNPKYFLMYVCSECHGAVVHTQNDPIYYCPNCGAKVVHDA